MYPRTYSLRSFESPYVMMLNFKGFDLNGKRVANTPLPR